MSDANVKQELVELQKFDGHDQPMTTSLKVAEYFERGHRHVLRDIKAVIAKCPKSFTEPNFGLSEYVDPTGRKLPMYLMTKDGFTLVAMGYTGEKAMKFKVDYITQFNDMTKALRSSRVAALSQALDQYDKNWNKTLAEKEQALTTAQQELTTAQMDSLKKDVQILRLEANIETLKDKNWMLNRTVSEYQQKLMTALNEKRDLSKERDYYKQTKHRIGSSREASALRKVRTMQEQVSYFKKMLSKLLDH